MLRVMGSHGGCKEKDVVRSQVERSLWTSPGAITEAEAEVQVLED